MTRPPEDDSLKRFLQQHRSPVPPPAPDLEARLMATIALTASPPPIVPTPQRWRRWGGAITAAVVGGLGVGLGVGLWSARSPELASLESFMEANWHSTISEPDSDLPVDLLSDAD